ncbi:MAG TPA: hypothetical protein VKX16_05145 [Chloroflexota bacterium]|nr:hypothetical protein [Chloroflexota bacterium]
MEVLARSACSAYILQTPVLVGIALALRPVALWPEMKFLLVALTATSASFGIAALSSIRPSLRLRMFRSGHGSSAPQLEQLVAEARARQSKGSVSTSGRRAR